MFEPGGTLRIDDEGQLREALAELDDRLTKIHVEMAEIHYRQFVTKQHDPKATELDLESARLMQYPGLLDAVLTWRDKARDPDLVTVLRILERSLVAAQVTADPEIIKLEQSINARSVEHRYQLLGRTVSLTDLRDILKRNPERSLREQASRAIGELHDRLEPDLRRLMMMRNELCQRHGYDTMVELGLNRLGTSLEEVKRTFATLADRTKDVFANMLRASAEGEGIYDIMDWDVQYLIERHSAIAPSLFPQEKLLPTLSRWAAEHGVPMEDNGIAVTVTDIPYNGLCMFIKPGDIRILSNPTDGYGFYGTLFHELGHGLHGAFIKDGRMFARYDSSLFAETMAETIGHVCRTPEWLQWYGLSESDAEKVQSAVSGPTIWNLRQRMSNALFEYGLYADPDCDAQRLFDQTEHDIMLCTPSGIRRWAANAWYANYPVYWQNYVLADLLAYQIHEALNKRFGSLHGHPEAMLHVRKVYMEPGALVDWRTKLTQDTGRALDPQPAIAALTA